MPDYKEKLISGEIKKLIPIIGRDGAARLSRAYLVGDEDTRQRLLELVDVIRAASSSVEEGSVLLEPMPAETASIGDIEVGKVMYGRREMYPIGLSKNSFLTHIGIFGSSGYGKTNLSYWLIMQLAKRNIPVLIFDFSKRNYRELLATEIKERVDVFTIGRDTVPFSFNPLIPPPGIHLSQWIKEFASIFDHAYWLLGGGRHIIMKALEAVYEVKQPPRLKDIKDWLSGYGEERLPPRERNWLSTATRPLESLCFKEMGKVFDCEKGVDVSGFFKEGRVTVLELDALDTNDKTFFIEITLQWLRDWLLSADSREKLKGVIILEEAHHVLNREKSVKIGSETVMDLIFREIRELGMGIVYIDQHPSLVSYPALGNTSTQIYMNLGLDSQRASDIRDASNMLGLDYEEEGQYLRKLPVGQGFMLCRGLPYTDSFLVRFNEVAVVKGSVNDAVLESFMRGRMKAIETGETDKEAETQDAPLEDMDIDQKSMDVIESIGSGAGCFTSQIYRDIRMSGKTFAGRASGLERAGLIGSIGAKIGKNRLTFYFLTDNGYRLFRQNFSVMEGVRPMDMDEVLETYSLFGWKAKWIGNVLYMKKGDKKLKVALIDSVDRESINKLIQDNTHFLCSGQESKNMLIQQVARHCSLNKKAKSVFIAMAERNSSGSFEMVEIGV
ncbi:MAG: ATP-binding protein [Candidatus Aenigmarchaeota archaeon]|nr:ATP-binding protein [Candidatus Aenigmarchaeota archaeon]